MSSSAGTCLLVDDDEAAIRSLQRSLERLSAPYNFIVAHDEERALSLLAEHRTDAAIVDLTLVPEEGPESGLRLIGRLQQADPALRILVLTGHGADEFGIEAMRMGASSFLQKPGDPSHLNALLADAVSTSRILRTQFDGTPTPAALARLTGLSSKNPKMQAVIEAVAFAASTAQAVLITGETGSGKGLIAQTIHRASKGRPGPFIRFQPNFSTPDLVTSELFGHKRGAFTGALEARTGLVEEANRGTLFIDEVDELPHQTQVTLLNVLQEKVFRPIGSTREVRSDFRLLTATNRDLNELLRAGKLRQDFYHRIAHMVISLPPLRERPEDIPDLSLQMVTELSSRERFSVQGLTTDALKKLSAHPWPGNIRELQAVVEGAVYRAQYSGRNMVGAEEIELHRPGNGLQGPKGASFRELVQRYELNLVREALRLSDNNQSQAAERLQLDRSTLRRILRRGES